MEKWYEAGTFGPYITTFEVVKETKSTLTVMRKAYSFSGDTKFVETRRNKTGFYRTFEAAKTSLVSKYRYQFDRAKRDLDMALGLMEECEAK